MGNVIPIYLDVITVLTMYSSSINPARLNQVKSQCLVYTYPYSALHPAEINPVNATFCVIQIELFFSYLPYPFIPVFPS